MRFRVIQHIAFETPALIAEWAETRGHELVTSFAPVDTLPTCDDTDFLVVLGGPMDADDEVASPWLHAEKRLIADCIAMGSPVLGICLGAQIIAEVLGGKVKRNPVKEIGWYPVDKIAQEDPESLFADWPDSFVAGHWHGDTFDLPVGLKPLYSSEACVNQAFVFDRCVVGLQFHVEWTEKSVADLVGECSAELDGGGPWVMSADEILDEAPQRVAANRASLMSLLDGMAAHLSVASLTTR
jgi:GMP synthase-like glutamine amidotransferase